MTGVLNGSSKNLNSRLGWNLQPSREVRFDSTTDRYGWTEDADGKWAYGLFVEGGRLRKKEGSDPRAAIQEIARSITCQFRLTALKILLLPAWNSGSKDKIESILKAHGVKLSNEVSSLIPFYCMYGSSHL